MTKKYILASISIWILLIFSILYVYGIKLTTFQNAIIPIIILISFLVLSITLYLSKRNITYNLGIIITFIINISLLYNILNINSNYNYLNNLITDEFKYTNYNIYVLKATPKYNNLEKLKEKKIGVYHNNYENTCKIVNSKVKIQCVEYMNVFSLERALKNGEIQSIIISPSIEKELPNKNKLRKITKIKIKEPKEL